MQSDEYSPNRFDPLKEGAIFSAMRSWTMTPTFTSPSQVLDCLARREAPATARKWRNDKLELACAAYVSIVGIERFIHAAASIVRRVGRYGMQQVSRRHMDAQPSAGRRRF